ncbi:MAG: alpha,alpha-trehalose-phosphate synthase (UDP-forming) [Alphaproteobacteria bacterium]|nr:alpha,alpha-trehalose-phosphate synthase (UDP-forming) [Alphaproteobacteria bacterium]
MARLVIVSNRVALPDDRAARAGGLAVALTEALSRQGGVWFGWSGEIVEQPSEEPRLAAQGNVTYATLDIAAADHDAFYVGYANSILWPLFHYRLGLIDYRQASLAGYLAMNERFARALLPLLQPDDLVWIHDYHFIPMAAALRRLGSTHHLGFFLHIPFPAPEVLSALPDHERLVSDLCAYDLVGLQTEGDVRALSDYLTQEARGLLHSDGMVSAFGQRTRVQAFPIGIDTDHFARLAASATRRKDSQRLRDSLLGRTLMIGVDRLDYSKGLPKRMEAYQELLARRPEHRSRVVYMQVAPISRGEVPEYKRLRRELEGMAGRINGKYAELDWMPVRYLNKSFARHALAGFYRASRVGIVTPARDGMNLVAKEYVAAQDPDDPGALVLSRFAGAARELDAALLVNPVDVERVADALHAALAMPAEERKARWARMMAVLRARDVAFWRESYLAALAHARDTGWGGIRALLGRLGVGGAARAAPL